VNSIYVEFGPLGLRGWKGGLSGFSADGSVGKFGIVGGVESVGRVRTGERVVTGGSIGGARDGLCEYGKSRFWYPLFRRAV
jgi:hypothetical protein